VLAITKSIDASSDSFVDRCRATHLLSRNTVTGWSGSPSDAAAWISPNRISS
jgi:hypothetical protein